VTDPVPAAPVPRPRKILLVISSKELGGGETHLLLLARCLQGDKLFEPHVVCGPGGELERVLTRMNVPVTPLELEDLRHSGDVLRLASLIRREQPALIHAHLNRAALWSSLLGRMLGRTVLCTAHGLTKSRYYRLASPVIAVSRAVADHLGNRAPGLASRISVIHNGIPLQTQVNPERTRQLREQYLIKPEHKVVTVVGKLHENKGQHVAIRAIQALPPTCPARLLVVGDGPARQELADLAALLSVGPRITFIPAQPRLYEIYALSDFVVVPSISEALSLVVLEALRQGRPVIASDTGGIPEIIRPGYNGVLVRPNDPASLAAAIDEGFRNYRRHETMAENGRKTVAETFGIEKCYLATRNLYLKLLGVPIA
jgi:glycosyltransferase involved in cell wall biosynthesis